MKFLFWKKREYPIKRDENGRSLRSQAFYFFDKGCRPSQIYKDQLVVTSKNNLYRYFEDWKKKKGLDDARMLRQIMKKNPDFNKRMIATISKHLEMPVEEVIKRLGRPWGLIQWLRGQWPNPRLEREQSGIETRLSTALWFVHFADLCRNTPDQISWLLAELSTMTENKKLEVTKEGGVLIIKCEGKTGSRTIRIPAFKEKIEGLPPPETEKINMVNNGDSEPKGNLNVLEIT